MSTNPYRCCACRRERRERGEPARLEASAWPDRECPRHEAIGILRCLADALAHPRFRDGLTVAEINALLTPHGVTFAPNPNGPERPPADLPPRPDAN